MQVPRTLEALALIADMPRGWCGAAARSCSSACGRRRCPIPRRPLPPRLRPDPLQAALARKLADITQAVARELHLSPRCWRRDATSSGSPPARATARCCAAGADTCSESGCWPLCEASSALAARAARTLPCAGAGLGAAAAARSARWFAARRGAARRSLAAGGALAGRAADFAPRGGPDARRLARRAYAERAVEPPRHLVDVALRIDRAQQAARAVELDQRARLLVVDLAGARRPWPRCRRGAGTGDAARRSWGRSPARGRRADVKVEHAAAVASRCAGRRCAARARA